MESKHLCFFPFARNFFFFYQQIYVFYIFRAWNITNFYFILWIFGFQIKICLINFLCGTVYRFPSFLINQVVITGSSVNKHFKQDGASCLRVKNNILIESLTNGKFFPFSPLAAFYESILNCTKHLFLKFEIIILIPIIHSCAFL